MPPLIKSFSSRSEKSSDTQIDDESLESESDIDRLQMNEGSHSDDVELGSEDDEPVKVTSRPIRKPKGKKGKKFADTVLLNLLRY